MIELQNYADDHNGEIAHPSDAFWLAFDEDDMSITVARHTGYKPGKFTHLIANEQIYTRQIDQAKELIHRANERHLVTFEALKNSEIDKNLMPKLVLNPEKNNFYDMTIDDFSMENYKPMKPQLTLPLGI